MKKYNLYLAASLFTLIGVACNEEPFSEGGEGDIILNAKVSAEMEVVTRADNETLQNSLIVWISNDKGVVRKYNSYDEIPSKINLLSGHYIAEAWAGDSVPASFDEIWYKGAQEFDVKKGTTSNVEINCKIANVGVSVQYDDNIENVLRNPMMVVGHKGGNLTFADEDVSRRGYFMMPSFDKNLTYTLTGTKIDGNDFTYTGVIEDAKPATEYILRVICNEKTDDVGGAIFSIIIDSKEIEMPHEIEIVMAPKIQGYDFDINSAIVAEETHVGRRSVYISSATKLSSVIVGSEIFKDFGFLNGNTDFNIHGMDEELIDLLSEEGINFKETYNQETDQTLFQLNFEEKLTNALKNGDYVINITATDVNKKTTEAGMRIIVSDAVVMPGEVINESISYKSAKLKGVVNKDGVEKIGFKYHKVGESDWTFVEGTVATRAYDKGTEYFAVLEGLEEDTEYEFYSVADDFESPVIESFRTLAHQQLPNAGFEDWFQDGKVWTPSKDLASKFWDTGNHGTSTLNKNITNKETAIKHSGSSAICMKSEYIILKFGAGNVFAGKYLKTDGMDGVIGMGRPFTDTPKKVRVWAKYEPKKVTSNTAGEHLKNGDMDQGQIYVALTDATTDTYNGESWPVVVKTKKSERNLFDPNAPRVIAYGEYIFDKATEGDGMVQIEFDLDYKRPDDKPSYIVFTASASRYGDYFEGGDGSTLYLDDIELIYE